MIRALFFPCRLHRLPYLLRGLVLDVITGVLYSSSTTFDSRFWWPAVIVLLVYGLLFVVSPRIRDAGMSQWWLLAMFVPIADIVFGILLLFRPPAMLAPASGGADASAQNGPETPPADPAVVEDCYKTAEH